MPGDLDGGAHTVEVVAGGGRVLDGHPGGENFISIKYSLFFY